MGCDLLDEGNFSAKEREILSKAGRILEMKVRAQSDVLNSPTLVSYLDGRRVLGRFACG